jgi:hypothetical protein
MKARAYRNLSSLDWDCVTNKTSLKKLWELVLGKVADGLYPLEERWAAARQ